MKQIIPALALIGIFAAPVFSQSTHNNNRDAQAGGMTTQSTQLNDLQSQMEKMKDLMVRIRSEQSPEVREKLLQEHMVAMEHGMAIMSGNMKKDSQMESMDADNRMDIMNHRMDMMQEMMEQMMGQMGGGMGASGGGMSGGMM